MHGRAAAWALFALSLALLWPGCADSLREAFTPSPDDPTVDPAVDPAGPLGPGGTPDGPDARDPSEPQVGEPNGEPLVLLSIQPARGLTSGNQEIVLTGTGFERGLQVLFGQAPGSDIFVLTSTQAIVLTPPHPAGLVDVAVRHPAVEQGAPRVLERAFRFDTEATIQAVEPAEGDARGGEPVTVRGSGFGAGTKAFIDGHQLIDQQRIDEATLTGLTPPGRVGPAHVNVVTAVMTVTAPGAYTYRTAPRLTGLSPLLGPSAGGTVVRLLGAGLSADSVVRFDDALAEVGDRSPVGAWLDVRSPPGPDGTVDVSIVTGWGAFVASDVWTWYGPDVDPFILDCFSLYPPSGPQAGGTSIAVGCLGLQYGAEVRIAGAVAEVLTLDADSGELVVRAPEAAAAGPVDVQVTTPYASTIAGTFTYEAPPTLRLEEVAPGSGPVAGGTTITLRGAGFTPQISVRVGALGASQVTHVDAATLTAVTPAGSPGAADVEVWTPSESAVLAGAFDYGDDELALDLVLPAWVARAGGTRMRIIGGGFSQDAEVVIGDVPCAEVTWISRTELSCRSPELATGLHDATVVQDGGAAVLPDAVTCFDPLSGYGGTWGGPIDGTVNVAVLGTGAFGPIAGATVLIADEDGVGWLGLTDAFGQVTASEEGLRGPLTVTATHPDFDAYSVVHFDALNVTVYLRQRVPPTGGGLPEGLPDAMLSGRVLGLDKYVPAVPGRCDPLVAGDGAQCSPCDPLVGCSAGLLDCVDLGAIQGHRCLASCEAPSDCPDGFACMGVGEIARCAPSPGERKAKCMVSRTSAFAGEPSVAEGGWVAPGEVYEIPSERLGELAVVCFAGYERPDGEFLPTMMGLRRHVFADSGATMTGLDVELSYRLDRDVRLRLVDPPVWPTGIRDPYVILSLELGADGWIPFGRSLFDLGDNTWLAPWQLSRMTGELLGSTYFVYSTLTADTSTSSPTSYHLLSGIERLFEDRLPVRSIDGGWELEPTQLDVDLHALWGVAGDRLFAVGQRGRIVRFNGAFWTAQSSPATATLRALAGRGDTDIWAAGDAGEVVHWDGISWSRVDAPLDAYQALATAPGQPLLAAGAIRVRRFDGDGWGIEGPPSLQRIKALSMAADGSAVAAGSGGRIFFRGVPGAGTAGDWKALASPTQRDLLGVWLAADGSELVAVGVDGTLVSGAPTGSLTLTELPADVAGFDLNAVTADPEGANTVVGDRGVVLRRDAESWVVEQVPDYRSRALAVHAPEDGGPVRIVGSVDLVLGPYMHYPIITAPVHDGADAALTIGWDAVGGPAPAYSRLILSEETGRIRWILVVDGDQDRVRLPDLPALAGFGALGQGRKRVEVTRVGNPEFDIDGYSTRQFSIYRRDTWSTGYGVFTSPE